MKIIILLLMLTSTSVFTIGCSSDNIAKGDGDINIKIEKDESKNNNKSNANLFMPQGNYDVEYSTSDMASNPINIKSNNKTYQIIGVSPKSPYIQVYTLKNNGIYKTYFEELSEEQFSDYKNIDYLNKTANISEECILKAPIKVGTKWDNKEIIEVGTDLQLDGLYIKGTYVKVWERLDKDTVKVSYYVEGVGCVKHKVILNNEIVEFSTIKSFKKY